MRKVLHEARLRRVIYTYAWVTRPIHHSDDTRAKVRRARPWATVSTAPQAHGAVLCVLRQPSRIHRLRTEATARPLASPIRLQHTLAATGRLPSDPIARAPPCALRRPTDRDCQLIGSAMGSVIVVCQLVSMGMRVWRRRGRQVACRECSGHRMQRARAMGRGFETRPPTSRAAENK